MTWVKVCGLSTEGMVAAAVDAGADAVGFVHWRRSPRHVELGRIARLAEGVPVATFLLTVDMAVPVVLGAVEETGLTGVQPYGAGADAVVAAALALGLTALRPVRAVEPLELPDADGSIPVLDTPNTDLPGGTGRSFPWQRVANLDVPFVLAGGLGPGNVGEAIAMVRPWGVDASSGLESSPGVKDVGKVTAFVEEAKRA